MHKGIYTHMFSCCVAYFDDGNEVNHQMTNGVQREGQVNAMQSVNLVG